MTATTVRVSGPDLHAALTAASVAADDPEEGFDHLATVWLEAGHGTLTVTATDRFIACHVRVPAEGDGVWREGIEIGLDQVAALVELTRDTGDRQPISLTMRGHGESRRLIVTGHSPWDTPIWQQVVLHLPSQPWPTAVVRQAYERSEAPDPGGLPVLRGGLLGRLGQVAAVWPDARCRISFHGPMEPVRADIGDSVVVVLMPVEPTHPETRTAVEHWPVPYGLLPPAAAST